MCEIKRINNQDEFERILFVCKARSNEKGHPLLAVVHVERMRSGSRLIATDGKRLHVTEISKRITSGDYQPTVTKDAITFDKPIADINFPNWLRVIPEQTETVTKGTIDLTGTGIGKNPKLTAKLSVEFGSFVRKTGTVVNLRFIEDLTKTEWVIFTQKEKNKALVLKQKTDPDKTFAVIMPLNEAA
ncbi:hypothetical protein FACS1894172_02890 [Spirochaetia bacterium]|nr:hypothetical protein FACS1894164_18530 [Spirochaetia bacterium]GHU30186.1 hypothetical protein FACS1894172_02890 [Spirochaetia bacterium]